MAITIKTLKGTNSVSADRITLNDNFAIITGAVNNILGIIDISTGKFDNSNIGSDNTITTKGITIKESGLDVQQGNININQGNLTLPSNNSYLGLGADGSKIKDTLVGVGASGPNSTHIVEFENFIGLSLPRLTTVEKNNLILGATGPNLVLFDSDTNKACVWDGTQYQDLY